MQILTSPILINKLIKLNNKLLRIIQDQPRRTHITELYENYSTLPVILLHQQNLILFAHNILHCSYKLPDWFRHYLDNKKQAVARIADRTAKNCRGHVI